MAEGRVDLPEELFSTKPGVESWGDKDDVSGRNYEEKELVGLPDDLKDQLSSENIIPLSPQWLYAKSSECKLGLSALSGENRGQNSLPQGTSADCIQKDGWRLDGSQDKKDWRRAVPDIEGSRRWREEERETGLLGRRERRKEGDRENEYRKSERKVDNVSAKETLDSRGMSLSERWHEVSSRNSGHENRRDSKWSSRWGPDDKEDPRTERKVDGDKEDARNEKQSFVASNRASSESDARDKWRPRHRQEVHSGGATVHRAAPGFGLDRGRADGPPTGFAPGRGRSNIIGNLPIGMPPVSGPIGSVNNIEAVNRKSYLSADTFRYPRGKLLDIYRKHKILSSCDTVPEGLENAPPITQSNLLVPLSFVTPDAEEGAVLEDIWKGKITSSDASYNLPREKMPRTNQSEAGDNGNDMTVVGGRPGIEISEVSESSVKSGSYACQKFDGGLGVEEHEGKAMTLMAEANLGDLTSKADDKFEMRGPCSGITSSNNIIDEMNGVGMLGLTSHVNSSNTANKESAAALDSHKKLPNDSSTVFDSSSFRDTVNVNELYQKNNEVKFEQGVPPEELSLLYRDPQGEIQGPFLGVDIISWLDQGFFGTDLPVCFSDAPEGTPFQQLGEVMPHLKLRAQPALVINPGDKPESVDLIMHNLEETPSVSDVSTKVVNEHRWESSEEGVILGRRDQQGLSKYNDPIDLHDGGFSSSKSESSLGLHCAENQGFREHTGSDVEEVLYSGKAVSSKASMLLKSASGLNDLGHGSKMHDLCSSEIGETSLPSNRVPANNDVHPLGLLWSELGGHPKRPLSMNLSAISGQGHLTHPELGNDISVLRKQQDAFSAIADSPDIHDAWRNVHNRDEGLARNALQDVMVSQQLSHLEQESSSRHGLEDHLLLQHLQMQHLQQQNLSAHQQPYLEQLQGARHQPSVNQPVPEMEHLLKLGFSPQQLLQLQNQQQQLLHHHPMHLLQQHQQQRQQQSHVQQLLFEQLLQQQMHEASVGRLRADPLHRNNTLDEILFREQLLRDLQQQSLQLRHHDPSLEYLIQAKLGHGLHPDHPKDILEVLSRSKQSQTLRDQQLFLGLQQDQHQGRQFPGGSRQFPVMEEERHAGRPWSVNESGQLVRKSSGQHWSQSSGPNPLDRLQIHQRQSTFEQPSHFDHNLSLHEHVQHGLYESRLQPFEIPPHSPAGVPTLNMELMSRLQGLDMQDQFSHVNSSGQMGQLPSTVHSHHQQIPNQFNPSRIDARDAHWSEPDGQLPSGLMESQLQQLHLEAERQRRNFRMNLTPEDPNAWAAAGNDEKSKQELREMLHKKKNIHSTQSLEMVNNSDSSYGMRGAAWPFPGPAPDRPFSLLVNQTGQDVLAEDTHGPKMGQILQEQLVNLGADAQANNIEGGKRMPYPTISGALMESEQPFSSVNGRKRSIFTDSITERSQSTEGMNVSEAKEGEKTKMHALKGGNTGLCNVVTEAKEPFCDEMIDDRVAGLFHPEGSKSSLSKRSQGSLSSREALIDLANVPVLKGGDISASSSEADNSEGRQGSRGVAVSQIPEIPSARKDPNFRRTSSCDGDVLGTSFIDMLKSTKKPTPEADSSAGGLEPDGGQGSKGGKKKGKKGRQIDPSLLGFKVHSNRIMMGEIQRPDD